MWEKEPSSKGNIDYIFLRDDDTCRFCELYQKSKDPKWRCHNPPNYHNPSLGSNKRGLIRLYKNNDSGHLEGYTNVILYEMIPTQWEEDEITINIKNKTGQVTKEWLDADYDPSSSLKMRAEDAEKIVKAIPLLKEPNIDLEEILGIKGLTLFEDKEAWINAYHELFGVLRGFMDKNAEVVPPLVDSPLLPLYSVMFGKPY